MNDETWLQELDGGEEVEGEVPPRKTGDMIHWKLLERNMIVLDCRAHRLPSGTKVYRLWMYDPHDPSNTHRYSYMEDELEERAPIIC